MTNNPPKAFTFTPAVRDHTYTLTSFSGASGSGKSYSALEYATGLAGGKKIAGIDTEAGRLKHYADHFQFDHCDFKPPFTPDRYMDAILQAEKDGYEVIIVDSVSHEWAGEGGIMDMQEETLERMSGGDYRKMGALTIPSWSKPKQAHKKMMSRLLQVRAHLIFCLRAEEKLSMETKTGEDGRKKTVIIAANDRPVHQRWRPICEKNFIYEMTTSILLLPDQPGVPIFTKLQEQHKDCFKHDEKISSRSGELMRGWAENQKSDLIKEGEDIALLGTERLKQYWNGLTQEQKAELLFHKPKLKTIAETEDAKISDTETETQPKDTDTSVSEDGEFFDGQ